MKSKILKSVKVLDEDEKYGKTYWGYVTDTEVPVRFSSHAHFSGGDKVEYEEYELKQGKKAQYVQLKKVRNAGGQQTPSEPSGELLTLIKEIHAVVVPSSDEKAHTSRDVATIADSAAAAQETILDDIDGEEIDLSDVPF